MFVAGAPTSIIRLTQMGAAIETRNYRLYILVALYCPQDFTNDRSRSFVKFR
jgi:hypothetical protein